MAWTNTPIDEDVSVSEQTTRLNGNAAYIDTTMSVNHYWDDSANTDGYHGYVQFIPEDSTPAAPGGDSKIGVFCEQKAAGEAVDVQPYVPFWKDNNSDVLEMLGIRACGIWDRVTSNGAITLQYSHNCTVARAGTGVYTVTFTTALPSNNYCLLGNCVRNDSSATNVGFWSVGASTDGSTKTTTSCQIRTYTFSGSPSAIDPYQTWFVAFGG